MATPKKWSEQILVERSFKTQENGKEVITTKNVLEVCVSGLSLFKKEFMNGKYAGKNTLRIPFDFVALAGDLCSKGKFYEVEYCLGEGGIVYRGLVQAVNPVTDIRLILGTLRERNFIPENFNPRRAWLREDIDYVHICYCFKEDGEACTSGGLYHEKGANTSVFEYTERAAAQGACIYFYRGDHKEAWTDLGFEKLVPKVFVCGSENVNDEEFAAKREADMEELREHLEEAEAIANDYGFHYVICMEEGKDDEGRDKLYINLKANATLWRSFCSYIEMLQEQPNEIDEDTDKVQD